MVSVGKLISIMLSVTAGICADAESSTGAEICADADIGVFDVVIVVVGGGVVTVVIDEVSEEDWLTSRRRVASPIDP